MLQYTYIYIFKKESKIKLHVRHFLFHPYFWFGSFKPTVSINVQYMSIDGLVISSTLFLVNYFYDFIYTYLFIYL
jgi:hypothetical protein